MKAEATKAVYYRCYHHIVDIGRCSFAAMGKSMGAMRGADVVQSDRQRGEKGEGIAEAGVHGDVPDGKLGARRISTPCLQSTQSSEIFYSPSSQISPPTQLKPLGFL